MLTKNINFINFQNKKKNKIISNKLKFILNENNEVIQSLSKNYTNSYNNRILKIFKKKFNFRIIGMGGSILGAQANRLNEIGDEWILNTAELVESIDTSLFTLLTNQEYTFPTVLPDGTYRQQ